MANNKSSFFPLHHRYHHADNNRREQYDCQAKTTKFTNMSRPKIAMALHFLHFTGIRYVQVKELVGHSRGVKSDIEVSGTILSPRTVDAHTEIEVSPQ